MFSRSFVQAVLKHHRSVSSNYHKLFLFNRYLNSCLNSTVCGEQSIQVSLYHCTYAAQNVGGVIFCFFHFTLLKFSSGFILTQIYIRFSAAM